MPIRNAHRVGDYLMLDDESGFVHYRSQMRRLWNGTWRHARNFETRQPQEFVMARNDPKALRFIRPDDQCEPDVCVPTFIGNTTISTPRKGPAAHLFDICSGAGATGSVSADVDGPLCVRLDMSMQAQIPRVSTPIVVDGPLCVRLGLQTINTGDICWAETTFITSFDGVQDNNTFTDESPKGQTITTVGDFHSQANAPGAKFGTAAGTGSIDADGNDTSDVSGYLRIEPDVTVIDVGTGDFVIEGWLYTNLGFGTNTTETIMSKAKSAAWASNNGFMLYLDSSGKMRWSADGTDGIVVGTSDRRNRDWFHFAVERFSGTTYLFIDGSIEDSSSVPSYTLDELNEEIYIGLKANNKVPSTQFTGMYDELAIRKCAKYKGQEFTPPTTAFPRF